MHLLKAGVNLAQIRSLYFHKIQTIKISARADSKQKLEVLEGAYVNVNPNPGNEGLWEKDSKLREWLKNFAI
jgi:integrase/recombinase XerD